MEKSNNLAVLILAAGTSSRLGEAKQLIKIRNESLLQIAVKKALHISSNVNVILGSKSHECQKELEDFDIKYFFNKEYEKGMGNSLSFGVSKITDVPKILVMLCDMPLIPISHFEKLIEKSEKYEDLIVCSKYSGKLAVPTIFPKKYFEMFKSIDAEKGAKKLLENNPSEFVELDDEKAIDIDTKEDFLKVLKSMNIL